MTGYVLVLNQDYRAISICSAERAMTLLWLGKADTIADKPDRFIRTSTISFPFPSIIRLRSYVNIPYRNVILSRRNVLRRDNFKCQYCGRQDGLTLDHVLPRSRGGKDAWDNLVAACVPCNNRKANKTPEEALMTLIRKPFRPSHVMFLRDYVGKVDEEWKPYLFLEKEKR
jgi:5-methylcytosine-specific restriction endonuclease McrA